MAVLAFVLGILAVGGAFLCALPGPVCGIPAIILGLDAQRRISASGGALAGAGLALAAWICGLTGVLISVVYVALLLAGILALGNLGYLTSP
jgi:hypothetical protein